MASWRNTVAMLKEGGLMLVRPSELHTKLVIAVGNLSGLTACIAPRKHVMMCIPKGV